MLAATLLLGMVAESLADHPGLAAVYLFGAILTKDTAVPSLFFSLVGATLIRRPKSSFLHRRDFVAAPGGLLGIAAAIGFNCFRYGTILNRAYLGDPKFIVSSLKIQAYVLCSDLVFTERWESFFFGRAFWSLALAATFHAIRRWREDGFVLAGFLAIWAALSGSHAGLLKVVGAARMVQLGAPLDAAVASGGAARLSLWNGFRCREMHSPNRAFGSIVLADIARGGSHGVSARACASSLSMGESRHRFG